MEINEQEAHLILGALDRVDVRGLETNRQVMVLAARLTAFVQKVETPAEEEDGDDVPASSE